MTSDYDFSRKIDREDTSSVKWDLRGEIFPNPDVTPLWVADADWPTAPEIKTALEERLEHGVFGYTYPSREIKNSICRWYKKRYDWSIEPDWIELIQGVVPGINVALNEFSAEGEGAIIQSPVYYPFYEVIEQNKNDLIKNPLYLSERDRYVMDYRDLEAKLSGDDSASILILCSPHNPVGRVWDEKELQRLGEICLEHDILMISDEIHADFIYGERAHHPLASLNKDVAHNSITFHAPTKTFNLAGLKIAFAVIPSEKIRERFTTASRRKISGSNIFGYEALRAAYDWGEDWLEAQLEYLENNLNRVRNIIGDMSSVNIIEPEGTYLVWLDFRSSGLSREEIRDVIYHKAEIGLEPGEWFGPEGEGFYRLNIATAASRLEKALCKLKDSWPLDEV